MVRPATIALLLVVANPAIAQVAAPSGQAERPDKGVPGERAKFGARQLPPVQALA